jgi:hypothetical protein
MHFTLIIRTVTSTMAVQRLKEQERRPAGLSKGNGYYLIPLKKLWNFSIITAELRVGNMFDTIVDLILDFIFMIMVLIMSVLGTVVFGR